MTASEAFPGQKGRTILITRVFDAPRELLWKVLTQPEHIVHWSNAGEGWTTPFAEADMREGGAFRIGYASPDGKENFTVEGTYRDVVPNKNYVMLLSDGRPVTFTLEDAGGKTKLSLELTLETEYPEEMQRKGWTAHLENLDSYLATLKR